MTTLVVVDVDPVVRERLRPIARQLYFHLTERAVTPLPSGDRRPRTRGPAGAPRRAVAARTGLFGPIESILGALNRSDDFDFSLAYGPPGRLRSAYLAGVDDYLKEPWDEDELVFRLERFMAAWPVETSAGRMTVNDCYLTHESGRRISLRRQEAMVLGVLARAAGETVPRDLLRRRLGGNLPVESRAVDMWISRSRTKLAACLGTPQAAALIESVRGAGYRLVVRSL